MRLLFSNWPVMVFLVIVVSMMAVADMNWPTHMGEQNAMIDRAISVALR
tara:strand:- start:706 stop:852 length:147 start_codon:yes stop_codon:yes gene_type:complete